MSRSSRPSAIWPWPWRSAGWGPTQLHAIQSVHNRRAFTGVTDWAAIAALYDGLVAIAPTVGAHVARAKARTHTDGPAAGLALLDELPRSAS